MEAWTVVFRNLYTGFLLRDFAGKIVPGALFLFSLLCLTRQPKEVFSEFKKELPIFVILLFAGFAWTVTLGTQSLAEGLHIWSYFAGERGAPSLHPQSVIKDLFEPAPDPTFDKDMLEVDDFQRIATEDEKQQYERYVVIKEACGNLFVAALLSIPLWVIRAVLKRQRQPGAHQALSPARMLRVVWCTYLVLVLVGLHRMHLQHAYRQTKWAQDMRAKHQRNEETKPLSLQLNVEQK